MTNRIAIAIANAWQHRWQRGMFAMHGKTMPHSTTTTRELRPQMVKSCRDLVDHHHLANAQANDDLGKEK